MSEKCPNDEVFICISSVSYTHLNTVAKVTSTGTTGTTEPEWPETVEATVLGGILGDLIIWFSFRCV